MIRRERNAKEERRDDESAVSAPSTSRPSPLLISLRAGKQLGGSREKGRKMTATRNDKRGKGKGRGKNWME